MSKRSREEVSEVSSVKRTKNGLPEGEDPEYPVRVYADGVYDLFHIGHMQQLEQCKKLFKYTHLVVGVSSDYDTHRLKGRTVMNEAERANSVRHCRWVDEVIPNAPWCLTPEFLKEHNIAYVAHDAIPYTAPGQEDIYQWIKDAGQFLETQRTEGISTTDLILRIVRDYDDFVRRNLARGVKREDMNVSYVKAQTLKVEANVSKFKEQVGKRVDKVKAEVKGTVDKITDKIQSLDEEPVGKSFDDSVNKFRDNIRVKFDDLKEHLKDWEDKSTELIGKFTEKYERGVHKVEQFLRQRFVRSPVDMSPDRDFLSANTLPLARDSSSNGSSNGV